VLVAWGEGWWLRGVVAAQGEDQTEVLEQARTQLATVVRERFRSAANKHDHAAVVRFTKLYVPLSLHTEGMQAFTGSGLMC
jgi:hypothetical protein